MSKILHCDHRNFDNVELPLQTCSRVCVLFSIIQSCKKDNTNISKKKWKAFVRTVSHKNILTYLFIYLFIQLRQVKLHEWHALCIQYKYNIIQVTNGGYTTTVKTNYCVPLIPGGYEEFKSWELSKGECVNARLLTFNVVYVVKHCITLHANTRVFFELWS